MIRLSRSQVIEEARQFFKDCYFKALDTSKSDHDAALDWAISATECLYEKFIADAAIEFFTSGVAVLVDHESVILWQEDGEGDGGEA